MSVAAEFITEEKGFLDHSFRKRKFTGLCTAGSVCEIISKDKDMLIASKLETIKWGPVPSMNHLPPSHRNRWTRWAGVGCLALSVGSEPHWEADCATGARSSEPNLPICKMCCPPGPVRMSRAKSNGFREYLGKPQGPVGKTLGCFLGQQAWGWEQARH